MGVDFAERSVVLAVARLARLKLNDAEVSRLGAQLTSILRYVEQIEAVNTEGVEPTAFAGRGEVERSAPPPRIELAPGACLDNAPDHAGGAFRVPKVL